MEEKTVTLRVPGMYCPKCEERVAMALAWLPGVTLVRADHVAGEVELRLDDDGASLAEARRRIEGIGYAVEPDESAE